MCSFCRLIRWSCWSCVCLGGSLCSLCCRQRVLLSLAADCSLGNRGLFGGSRRVMLPPELGEHGFVALAFCAAARLVLGHRGGSSPGWPTPACCSRRCRRPRVPAKMGGAEPASFHLGLAGGRIGTQRHKGFLQQQRYESPNRRQDK